MKVEFRHLFSFQKRFSLCSSHKINANIDVFCWLTGLQWNNSSIWVHLSYHLRGIVRGIGPLRMTESDVSHVTGSNVNHVTGSDPVRKYVLCIRNRKLRHIRPSGTFWPKVTKSRYRKRPGPEVFLTGSRFCACPAFSPRFFLSSSNMATGCDLRSLDPLRGSLGCAQPEVVQHP